MTTRRRFIVGLLATAAAPACPAQPATEFRWTEIAVPIPGSVVNVPSRIWFHSGPSLIYWSDTQDFNSWGKA